LPSHLATAQGTAAYAENHPRSAFNPLGDTGLTVSQAGFGGYRISPEDEAHGQAMAQALTSGINLIDTSANYMDGGSETLAGRVLADLFEQGRLKREEVVVVTKAGYLQGRNYALSQERKEQGRPFAELVDLGQGLEHCIHPEFLADQLTRSLKRLGLAAMDVFLLHNPEYYLEWAAHQKTALADVQAEYYRRIVQAFAYLEEEAADGRIGCYGISSNTFVSPADDPQFTCLARVWQAAQAVSAHNRFRAVQFPFNLLETGAVTEKNQPDGRSVLEYAREKNLAVLINRPLNAMTRKRLVRLAGEEAPPAPEKTQVMELLMDLMDSEDRINLSLLPNLRLEPGVASKLAENIFVGRALLAHWEGMQGLEHWRTLQGQYFIPRLNAAFAHLARTLAGSPEGLSVLNDHLALARAAFSGLTAWYQAADSALAAQIKQKTAALDADWAKAATLSQMALRALRSTTGVTTVLMGMRSAEYVADVLTELARPVEQASRQETWHALRDALVSL
jgi:aryl-alcohol dehydrogenase-like predicted oxidoreductase